ncbi:GSCFA domain-containing protein [Sediminibacterium sp. C3]|uniref:GSCFA domain-containing protein n=1 Tax=Sediminibacterium sp. C3 TaxID=1267211 RepID=UPI00041904CF|nr:GSCFA domain-containing protein [Sediminibacterium sp. C3]
MKFHFDFPIKKMDSPMAHHHRILMMGSCFTENIGQYLRSHSFQVLENPNGILFNPVSVADAIYSYINKVSINEEDLFQLNETWHSWKFHSRYSGITKEEALTKMNHSIDEAHQFLKTASYMIVTLGSAWVYELTDAAYGTAGNIVANNHKAPASWFHRRLLTAEGVQNLLASVIDSLRNFNPILKIIFTISPVRHLREGVIENNRSKAVLIQAVHDLVAAYEHLYYFPSYELVIDDLRDYRFYAEDLVHPNYQATQYVWEKFVDACIDESSSQLFKTIREIKLAYQHKPFNPSTQQHQQFLNKYELVTQRLMEQYPYLRLQVELDYFRSGVRNQEQVD